jgi:hypothetical protein
VDVLFILTVQENYILTNTFKNLDLNENIITNSDSEEKKIYRVIINDCPIAVGVENPHKF